MRKSEWTSQYRTQNMTTFTGLSGNMTWNSTESNLTSIDITEMWQSRMREVC